VHSSSLHPWQHEHAFGQRVRKAGERRTAVVTALTAAMMVVEIGAGLAFASMALLADGLHMASHAAALGLALAAYVYARRHADDRRFTFGTGKVNALAGYSSAVVLALVAAWMAVESCIRLVQPRPIDFDQAIPVAILGLVVNLVSLLVLRDHGDHDHHHAHAQGHAHAHDGHGHGHAHADARHHHGEDHGHGHRAAPVRGEDHNLRGAYLHVLADALTSLLAIGSLGAGAMLGWLWPDAAVGLLGAALVGRWALGLMRDSSGVLLDREAPAVVQEQVRRAIERDGDSKVADLHVWSVGPDGWAAALSVVAHHPRAPEEYRADIPHAARVLHTTIEVHRCAETDRHPTLS
jgi:cation diffusion facilitator family transporter